MQGSLRPSHPDAPTRELEACWGVVYIKDSACRSYSLQL